MNETRVKIQSVEMEQDVRFEPHPIPVTARLLHQQLDATVDAFGHGIAEAMSEDTDNADKMGFQCASHGLDRLQLGSHDERMPLLEKGPPVIRINAVLEHTPQLFEAPGTRAVFNVLCFNISKRAA